MGFHGCRGGCRGWCLRCGCSWFFWVMCHGYTTDFFLLLVAFLIFLDFLEVGKLGSWEVRIMVMVFETRKETLLFLL